MKDKREEEMFLTTGMRVLIHYNGATLDMGADTKSVFLPLADLEEMAVVVRAVAEVDAGGAG